MKSGFDKILLNKMFFSLCIIGMIAVLILSGCSEKVEKVGNKLNSTPSVTAVQSFEPSQVEILTPTVLQPTQAVIEEMAASPITETQEPPIIANNETTGYQYLFRSAIVTFTTPFLMGENYLNLDDIFDSTPENSDILMEHTGLGDDLYYSLFPINGATFYYSDLHGMTYDTCMEHFPFINMTPDFYSRQSRSLNSGRDYCVLTKDGHLSILRFEPKSKILQSSDRQNLYPELVVTTFKQTIVIDQDLTPTETSSKNALVDKYAGKNLTEIQKESLDKAAQALIDAVNSGDRNTVAGMIDYPIPLDIETEEFIITAKDQADFLSVYGEIFTPLVLQEFKTATVEQNMGLHLSGMISLYLPDIVVKFYPDGKLSQISKSAYWRNSQ